MSKDQDYFQILGPGEETDYEKRPVADPSKQGIFVYHRCYKCSDGERPCVEGNPRQCGYPIARDD